MATNLPPDWNKYYDEFLRAKTKEERVRALEAVLSHTPKNKATENLRAQLRRKLSLIKKEKILIKTRKSISVPKQGAAQVSILGMPNSGKSTFLNKMTGAKTKIADYPYTTKEPEVGVTDYKKVKIQLVEIPSTFEPQMLGIAQNSDLIILLLDHRKNLSEQKKEIKKLIQNLHKKYIWVKNNEAIEEIKEKIWNALDLIKIYTKNQGKKKEDMPITLPRGSTVKTVARNIHKDFLKYFRFARIYGPSAKFPGEIVGLEHELEDNDTVELHMR